MKQLRLGVGLALAACALCASSAAAAPRLIRVKDHLPGGVIAVNASGDVLGYWANEKGIGTEGVLSPQGAELEHFIDFPPRPEVQGGSFGANSNSIYAGVVQSHGLKGRVFLAQVSLSGKILQKFGTAKAHNVANPWEYASVQVAANGDGWTLRVGTGVLYRFHV